MRVWLVGLGTVGRWLLGALQDPSGDLARRHGFSAIVVGAANARDGFVHDPNGLNVAALLSLLGEGRPITELDGVSHFSSALEGVRSTEADALVEVANSAQTEAEPGAAHMREALARGLPVATSNKWPVALKGVELAAMARRNGTEFRAESTVMSGTPALAALSDGLAGARPMSLRGIVSATANSIVSRMAAGESYADALVAAQAAGLAEPDPAADVEGWDSVAKVMVLAGLVFGRQLAPDDISRSGISELAPDAVAEAAAAGTPIRPLETLTFAEPGGVGALEATVAPVALSASDPLARVDGVRCAVTCTADPLGEVTVLGPGAGPQLAGLGALSDLIAIARRRAPGKSERPG